MEDVLQKYFRYVFTEDFFTVALDATGCFLYTTYPDDNEIISQFNQFKSCQCLSDEQCVLCVVGRKSCLSYCSWHLLDSYVMKVTQGRKIVLSWKEQRSILECYGVPVEKNSIRHEEPGKVEVEEVCLKSHREIRILDVFLALIILGLGVLVLWGCIDPHGLINWVKSGGVV